jgi:hypothetical protein
MRANKKSLVCVSVLATLVAAGLVVATSSPLAAQEAPVEPGARVRVTSPRPRHQQVHRRAGGGGW